ncbi:hypothetical protein CMUS01_15432 [Colletotrichum musicola]|uniref:Uncharacterized protein n=1 Tax=Colletotrichum musicola TaxID=2175873 RepID=A0A8H6IWP9_9PEZI|nr:hypothetical protein CMUS01_15432 [Colletotrichum musicola]
MNRLAYKGTIPPRQFHWNRPITRNPDTIPRIEAELIARKEYPEDSREQTLLQIFLDIPEFSPRLGYEYRPFDRFLGASILERASTGHFEHPNQLAVWLHDTSHTGGLRPYNGSVTLMDFFRLSKNEEAGEDGNTNVDIRKMSLDCQIPAMKRLIYKHLASETSVGLVASNHIANNFILEHHMPCYVWTSDPNPGRDSRHTTDDQSLRKSIDLSFLSGARNRRGTTSGSEYLHECQTSICVTGWNVDSWTAICLTDNFFDINAADPNNENGLEFYTPENDEDQTDAMSIGQMMADKFSIKDPREYFFLIVKFRTMRMAEQWHNIAFNMREKVREYLSSDPMPLTRRQSSLATAEGDSRVITDNEAWVNQTSDLLRDLLINLSKSIMAWQKVFKDIDTIVNGADEDMKSRIYGSVAETSDLMEEMQTVLEELESLKLKVEDFSRHLATRVAVDGRGAIVLQLWNVVILQFFSPMAIAGSIMQAGMSFGPAVLCFTFLTGLFTFITWNMKHCVTFYEQLFGKKAGQLPNNELPALQSPPEILPVRATQTSFLPLQNPASTYHRVRHPRDDRYGSEAV